MLSRKRLPRPQLVLKSGGKRRSSSRITSLLTCSTLISRDLNPSGLVSLRKFSEPTLDVMITIESLK